ncbi:ribokinase [Sporomusa acidovorans]|uniref:Ribokinase n=1 Tax=Sporomusa acidovorans (strain ATCC 49682 / DSM 3132 / Mol) TaxID=1123286 RepID=A0ABZ3J680_SPOA4|nr:ribokinase [Sporomusa acidovorans]OZC21045.1 ribokinase [Sporomusa acidovorans DSM 3132]SDF17603.1 ribokinase [Sporomusa acidovorans]
MNTVCIIGSYAKALVMTVDRIPLVGETLLGYDYRETYGGKGSDMAVQAARLRATVNYIGVVGEDNFGTEFIRLMKAEGVTTDGIRVTTEKPTGVGFIVKDKQAQNVIVVDKGANELFGPDDIDKHSALMEAADIVLAQLEIPVDTALYALKRAKKMGKTTVLNPAPAIDLSRYDLSFVDMITPNETEARVAIGERPEVAMTHREVAEILLKTGCGKVIMTLGGNGVDIHSSEASRHVDCYKIDVVDSNGAGDSFNAALCVGLAARKNLTDAVAYANAVAGLCCTKWETVPSYHTAAEVESFIKKQS